MILILFVQHKLTNASIRTLANSRYASVIRIGWTHSMGKSERLELFRIKLQESEGESTVTPPKNSRPASL